MSKWKKGDDDDRSDDGCWHRTVNIPWSWEEVTDGDYIYAFQQVVMPIAMEFAPSLVIGKSREREREQKEEDSCVDH